MNKDVSIVLSVEKHNYRKVAQQWYGLTDAQMVEMDVHHNPPRQDGGRNIPEHLYVYHHTLHSAVHGDSFTLWSRTGIERSHKRKNPDGKSVHAVEAACKLHDEKNEEGKSLQGVRNGETLHEEKDAKGKSVNAVKGGKASTNQVWESTRDGFRSHAAAVSRHNKANGWDPADRVRVK